VLVNMEQSINSDDSKPLREYPKDDDDDRVSVSSYNTVRTRTTTMVSAAPPAED